MGHKDVSKSEADLLVAMYEEGNIMVCRALLDLHKSQGRTSETPHKHAIITYSHVEMGKDYHGFHHKAAKDDTWSYLGHC